MNCLCGCGQETKIAHQTDAGKGWIKGRSLKYLKWHRGRLSQAEYITNKKTNCWEWQRSRLGKYGQKHEYGEKLAHRVYYIKHKGPIAEGLVIDHLCRNTLCVNPHHLEVVTKAENSRRGVHSKLTKNDVKIIRESRLLGKKLSVMFGVSQQTICDVKKNRSWVETGLCRQ